ncbi:FAD-dependent oxidoreductase [Lentilactobacillus sp. Marseille-Q4993]|uniref:FAD-dependent oxidoreductase n=1 Tax=Lentilactobacillus sp. Marseille-Q4993 TaxID=3039492 RepID=UPI0024BCD213|nr:FAD-dependent oxidoreductase [Lentilactobacillus sp. Marseille-Q4993]
MKYVVIGGIAGGPSFATRLSRIDKDAEIIILEKDIAISVASCAIPYYLGNIIDDRNTLIERTPEVLKAKNNIDVRLNNEVTAIDSNNQQLSVTDHSSGEEYTERYDKLILATGASPTFPPIPGIEDADDAFVLRSLSQADQIKSFIDEKSPKQVTIVGAGTIGIELAESFITRGIDVSIVEQSDQIAAPYDSEITDILKDHLKDKGVKLYLNQTVASIEDNGHTINYADGTVHQTDMVFLGTGVKPNSEIAAATGVKTTADGHIPVNNQFETNVNNIYAIGDVIETTSLIDGQPIPSLLSSAANRQGHLLADILNGEPLEYNGFIGTGASKLFDLTASFVGYTELMLKAKGVSNYKTVFITPFDHAYFYPGADRVNFKLLYEDKTGKILGGEAIGTQGVDKRISQLSVAITGNLSVFDLPALEIPYSPPYSSTRDVLNIAGYVAMHSLTDGVETIKESDIPDDIKSNAVFLDIKEAGKPTMGNIQPTLNIPLNELRDRINELPREQPVYITFRKGIGPYNASRILASEGIKAVIIEE